LDFFIVKKLVKEERVPIFAAPYKRERSLIRSKEVKTGVGNIFKNKFRTICRIEKHSYLCSPNQGVH